MSFLLVAIGGFIGSILRFYISLAAKNKLVATWTANITGSIILAFSYHFYLTDTISHSSWIFIGIGFCGAYTTFSTFGNETLQLILDREYRAATFYVIGTLSVSLIVVAVILYLL